MVSVLVPPLTVMFEVCVAVAVCVLDWLPIVTVRPALRFDFTFMPRPPYGVVTFVVLVMGLRPLGSRVAIEVSLERTSHGLFPLLPATRASSLESILPKYLCQANCARIKLTA